MLVQQKRSIVEKLHTAIKEKRFFKTSLYFFLRLVLGEQKYVKTIFSLDYAFGKKELNLTRKYRAQIYQKNKKDKITVVVVIWMTEMWNSLKPVYEIIAKNLMFDAYILAQPHLFDTKNQKGQNPAYEILSKMYETKTVINAFQNGKWFDLKDLNPDYVFYSYPYEMYYHDSYQSKAVREYAKICLIQYGYNFEIDSTFCISHNFEFLKNVAIHFVANGTINSTLQKVFGKKYAYPKVVNFGYPRFDLLDVNNTFDSKTILWTPRWTSADLKFNKQSHFLSYYKEFLNFAKNHSDVTVIIRPHPLMFSNFLRKGVMTQNEIDNFKAQCKSIENIELDENADYIPSVKRASVIVSDFSALLAEYFVMEKPVIYCDGNRGFSKEAMIMDSCLYHATKWSEIEKQVLSLLSGKDEMTEKRIESLKDFLPNGRGKAAEHILDFIRKDYYGA